MAEAVKNLKNAISVALLLVTPKMAMEMIRRSERALKGAKITQRPVNMSKVDKYTEDIINNEWFVTGEGLSIGPNGEIINGQHRLHAIIKSGVSVHMVVVENVDVRSFYKIDPPEQQRTIPDLIVIISGSEVKGYEASQLAAIARPMLMGARRTKKLTRQEVAEHAYRHRRLIFLMINEIGSLDGLKMPPAITAAFCNAALSYNNPDRALDLARAWRTETYKKATRPVAMAKAAVREASNTAMAKYKRPSPRLLYRLCCNALKAAMENKNINKVDEDFKGFKGVG